MSTLPQKAFVITTLLITTCSSNSATAQQKDIPGVTDITSVTTISSHTPASLVRFLNKACQDSAHFIGQVEKLKGWVEHRADLQSYVISYAIENTFDSEVTAIICNWPEAGKWVGRAVTFSGRYYRGPSLLIRHAGESLVYVHLTSIEKSQ